MKRSIFFILVAVFVFSVIDPPVQYPVIELDSPENTIRDRIDEFGMTNLHRAVIRGKIRIVKTLIRHSVDLDKTDNYGWSALHWSNFLRRKDLSDLLIMKGAKTDIRSTKNWFIYKSGTLPLDIK